MFPLINVFRIAWDIQWESIYKVFILKGISRDMIEFDLEWMKELYAIGKDYRTKIMRGR